MSEVGHRRTLVVVVHDDGGPRWTGRVVGTRYSNFDIHGLPPSLTLGAMFSDSSEDEGDKNVQLTINEHYAKAFEYRKEREELEQLKEKYGSDFNESDLDVSTDSESAESEDEDGEELTPAVDAAILRTLARIRKKDPAIYDTEKNIFGEEKEKVSTAAGPSKKKEKNRSKPLTLRQVAFDAVVNGSRSPSPEPAIPTHMEEQEALRNETIKAFHNAVADGYDDDDLLVPREKAKDELQDEEEEYKAYLERQVGDDLKGLINIERTAEDDEGSHGDDEAGVDEEGKQDDKKKKRKKKKKEKKVVEEKPKKTKAEQDQEFLMSYILNRGWVDNSSYRVPTYQEITGDGEKAKSKGKEKAVNGGQEGEGAPNEMDTGLLSDTSFESLADVFETSYNHRFEEPDAGIIKSFPRQIESTIRRTDATRKDARQRKKERKEAELAKQKGEVKRLKALKMKEIKRKLEKIGMESGFGLKAEEGDFDALNELDLEGDWDPEKHDQQVKDLFPEEEEEEEEELQYDADGKPIWKDDIDLDDIPISDDDAVPVRKSKKDLKKEKKEKKEKNKKKKSGEDEEEEDAVDVDMMDADKIGEGAGNEEEWDGTEEMRKRKWKEYMDSLDELDFNDMVGDMPTRFKYVPVQQQTYSLDPVEILLATDQELNEYMSVKKYAPYRQDKGDRSRWDPRQQEKLKELKDNLEQRKVGYGFIANHSATRGKRNANANDEDGEKSKKKRKGKKERMKMKTVEDGVAEDGAAQNVVAEEPPAKKRKRDPDDKTSIAAHDRIAATEDGTKRKKRRRRQTKEGGREES